MKIIFSIIIILFIFPILFILSYSQDEIENLLKLANSYADVQNFEEQIKIYDKILEIDPNNVQALNGKGATLIVLSNEGEGIMLVNKALEIDPNFVPAITNKGSWLGIIGDIDEALEYFDRALQIDPEDFNTLFNKANALKLRDPNEGIDVLDRILTIDPDNKRAIEEKTNMLKSFNESRVDGHLQTILRNSDGQLIGYIESDVILLSNYKITDNTFLNLADYVEIVTLDGEEYYRAFAGDTIEISTKNGLRMRTGINYIFSSIAPQNEEIPFQAITGRLHGYMVEEGDTAQSMFQLLFPKGDFTEEESK